MPKLFRQLLTRLQIATGLVIFIAAQTVFAAGSATLQGRVFDKETKQALPGATVLVKGTSIGASTDLNGGFVIHNVPSGEQTVVVQYVGYSPSSEKMDVPANQTITKDFYLTATAVQGKVVVVTAQAEGQMQAINEQLASNKIVNIVSSAKIQALPDFNAAGAIGRLPGVSVTRSDGEAQKVVINGIQPQYNEVAVNGVTMASTGSDQIGVSSQGFTAGGVSNDRSVDLAMVSPYMIKTIEVYKDLLPDMNANAVGGFVNMQLREAPRGFHTNLLWQSGYGQKANTYGNYRAVASMSDRFFNNMLGVYVLGDAESYNRNADIMNASYGVATQSGFTTGYPPVEVLNVTFDRHIETRNRYGANAILDYKLPDGLIRSVNMYSELASNAQDYTQELDYQNHPMDFSYSNSKNSVTEAVNSLEWQNNFGFMTADLLAANTYSRNLLPPEPNFQFNQTGGVAPGGVGADVLPQNLTGLDTYFGPSQNYLTTVNLFSSDYKENKQHYKADFKIPLTAGPDVSGYFKFGGEYDYNYITNAQNTPYATMTNGVAISDSMTAGVARTFNAVFDSAAGKFPATSFTSTNSSLYSSFLNNEFGPFYWAANSGLMNSIVNYIASNPLFSASGPLFSSAQPGGWFDGLYQTLANNYKYVDRYYAAYAMAQVNAGPLMVVGGARFEQDKGLYQAFNMVDSRNPKIQPVDTVTAYPQNHYWLPMVQAKFDITNWLNLRFAYTQTLARPAYSDLSPHIVMGYTRQQVYGANPYLTPGQAYNNDLILTAYSSSLGLFSVDGFYKTLKNFVYGTQYPLLATPPPGFLGYTNPKFNVTGVTPNEGAIFYTDVNSKYLAYVKGLGFQFETRFWYLPGAFSGLLAGINYTLISSSARYPVIDQVTLVNATTHLRSIAIVDTSVAGRLIDQPNNIMNAYVGYDYEGFAARVSFLFQGNSVSYVSNYPVADGYTENYFRIDAQVRQDLPWKGLQVYFDASNINDEFDRSAQPSIGGFTNEVNYGLTADLGVRYQL